MGHRQQGSGASAACGGAETERQCFAHLMPDKPATIVSGMLSGAYRPVDGVVCNIDGLFCCALQLVLKATSWRATAAAATMTMSCMASAYPSTTTTTARGKGSLPAGFLLQWTFSGAVTCSRCVLAMSAHQACSWCGTGCPTPMLLIGGNTVDIKYAATVLAAQAVLMSVCLQTESEPAVRLLTESLQLPL